MTLKKIDRYEMAIFNKKDCLCSPVLIKKTDGEVVKFSDLEKANELQEEIINALIKIYPEISEEWEEENDIYIKDIVEKYYGKPWEEIIK